MYGNYFVTPAFHFLRIAASGSLLFSLQCDVGGKDFVSKSKIKNIIMNDIKSILLDLKEQALAATKNADANFYQNYLDDHAIAIVPFGIFDKNAIVQQMGSANSNFKSSRIDDTRAIVLTPESGIVTYKATYEKGDKKAFEVFVTTVYAKVRGEWKGVFYQQTPMEK